MGCDPQAVPILGRLAFADQTAKRLVALDLQTGKGWQTQLSPVWVDWSPGALKLLAAESAAASTSNESKYDVFSAAGAVRSDLYRSAGGRERTHLAAGRQSEPGWQSAILRRHAGASGIYPGYDLAAACCPGAGQGESLPDRGPADG